MKISARKAAAGALTVVGAVTATAALANVFTAETDAAARPACPAGRTPAAIEGSFETRLSASAPQRYAPLVFLHPKERFLPMPANCFVANSSLEWAEGPRRESGVAERGEVTAENLLRPGYEVSGFTTRDRTRPFAKDRPPALKGRRGFYLDLDDRFRRGATSTEKDVFFSGTPVYYDYMPGRYVTYWLFYGFSAPGGRIPGQLRRAGATGHEGDWEGISIKLDERDEAMSTAYFAHGEGVRPVDWAKVKKLGDHPIVFSARGSHASYTTPGRQRHFDVTGGGPIWATWLLLADVQQQPWYGYGGAWGFARLMPSAVKEVAKRLRIRVHDGDFTGPLGPPFKASPFAEPSQATTPTPLQ